MFQNKQILLQPINQKKPNPKIRIGPCCFPTHLTQKTALLMYKMVCGLSHHAPKNMFCSNVSPFRYIEVPFRKCLPFFAKGICVKVSGIQGANVPERTRRLVRGFHFHQDIYKVDEPWLILTKLKWHSLKHDPPSKQQQQQQPPSTSQPFCRGIPYRDVRLELL